MGATRDVALTELPIRGISTNADASGVTTITLVPSDSGVIFINKEDAGDVTYELPAVADAAGKMFWFFNANAVEEILVTAPSACMYHSGALITTMTSPTDVGGCAFVVGDGSNYYFFEIEGVWTTG